MSCLPTINGKRYKNIRDLIVQNNLEKKALDYFKIKSINEQKVEPSRQLDLFEDSTPELQDFFSGLEKYTGKTPSKNGLKTIPNNITSISKFEGTPIEYVDLIGYTPSGVRIGARNINRGEKILVDLEAMKEKFESKAWATTTQTVPLAEDAFKTYQELIMFMLLHEKAHEYILQNPLETKYDYENRVNEEALRRLQEEYDTTTQTEEGLEYSPIKEEGVKELFESNLELANEVYEALGFKTKPDIILPIGTSGSGKSTFIKSLPQENLVVIEPDAMRVEFTGDMNNKSKDKEIYEEAANRAIQAIKQGKQVVFDTTNLTKDKRLPFIEAIKKAIPTANIQYKLMELNPELAKQRIKAQLARGENRAAVSDETIDRHAASYRQMLEDIKSEPISNFEITPQQKQQAQQLYSEYLEQNPNGSAEGFKKWVDNNQSNVQYQLPQDREIEEFVASEKTIRDLAARMSDRIGIPIIFESDRSKKYKGKIENNTAHINLAYATLDTPIHEILGHPIIRAIKNKLESQNNLHATNDGRFVLIKNDKSKIFFNTYQEAKDYIKEVNQGQLYNNLLKELEYDKGKEVLDRIKRDYHYKNATKEQIESDELYVSLGAESSLTKYTLEEQQEEAIVELLGLYTADRLDNVKDGKLISLLKRLLKEMKAFMKSLINQKEVEIDKLPDNMTLGDIADLLAYSNSKLILPGYEVVYTTPDNQQFKTYAEASNHISELAKSVQDVDLSNVKLNKEIKGNYYNLKLNEPYYYRDSNFVVYKDGDILKGINDEAKRLYPKLENKKYYKFSLNIAKWELEFTEIKGEELKTKLTQNNLAGIYAADDIKDANFTDIEINNFIEKNKEYEQSKEIIEEWKKVNNIQYNPEEVYSRGQEFVSVVGAYSDFDVNLMMQNLLQHIEDNQKAGGEFTISAFTKPIDRQINHLEGGGGKIKFKIYPQSQDIKWAANTDAFSGSVWDASEKVNKDKKSELLGVSYTKYPSLRNVNEVQSNLAAIVDDLAHHHNELGISLTGNNFRLEYDENIPYSTKKIINSINSILDQKYGKLVKPKIDRLEKNDFRYTVEWNDIQNPNEKFHFKTEKEAIDYATKLNTENGNTKTEEDIEDYGGYVVRFTTHKQGIQPTQTNETLKESIESVKIHYGGDRNNAELLTDKLNKEIETLGNLKEILAEKPDNWSINNAIKKKETQIEELKNTIEKLGGNNEYTSQALINTKIAALKEVAKKYPRSLIRSEVRPISSSSNLGFTEIVFQKPPQSKNWVDNKESQTGVTESQENLNNSTNLSNFEKLGFINITC